MMNKKINLILAALFILGSAYAQEAALRRKNYNLEENLAIQGYDPVAYFTTAKAVKGKKENAYEYKGVTYWFSTAQNKDLFKSDPSKYEPQYGGWCAYAMGSSGEKVEIDPETFKILDGKLFLFYNAYFNNTLKKWNTNEKELKKKADVNWSKTNQ
jgi:YHS domain-containing protein